MLFIERCDEKGTSRLASIGLITGKFGFVSKNV
jgi:hypothetical protein